MVETTGLHHVTAIAGDPTLLFADPDGIGLGLVATDAERPGVHWADGPVPADTGIRGFHGVELAVAEAEPTAAVLTGIGFERVAGADGAVRYDTGADGIGTVVDLVETDADRGTMGTGTVHHVAFRLADEDEAEAMRERLADLGLSPTKLIDRTYFGSIYAREPGGVLFEFATLGPGFDVDEPVDRLGERLALPEWLESEREEIEARLPAFEPPRAGDD
jgi:glyoxalase family protein